MHVHRGMHVPLAYATVSRRRRLTLERHLLQSLSLEGVNAVRKKRKNRLTLQRIGLSILIEKKRSQAHSWTQIGRVDS